MKLIFALALAYLLGSVPFALVIGKVFYKTDVRQHGSGNLGGGNTGRVLGKKAGLAVMTMDILKVTCSMLTAKLLCGTESAAVYAALAAAVGHCWPVFARFRGGKAVATLYGFCFGLWVLFGCGPFVFFLPLLVFLCVLYLTKIISLSSMISALAATVYFFFAASLPVCLAGIFFTVLIVLRHGKNIRRMAAGSENKITWM